MNFYVFSILIQSKMCPEYIDNIFLTVKADTEHLARLAIIRSYIDNGYYIRGIQLKNAKCF